MLIVMFLMLLVFSSHRAMRRATQRRQAVVEARALVQAALAYRQVYGAWPLQDRLLRQPEYDEDIVVGDPATVQDIMLNQSNVVEVLRASGDLTLNPRRQVFLDVPDNRVASGGFMDPWGHAYVLLLDADGNGYTQTRVADLTGRRAPVEDVLNEPAAAFSWGEETGRITSWSESP